QLRRTLPSRSCRLRCPNSVGSTSPPPSSTTHLHVAQVPPPPQAEGRNICCMARVVSSELPAGATKGLLSSPFMTIFTGPDCTSFDCAYSSITTSRRIMRVKATIDVMISISRNDFTPQIYYRRNDSARNSPYFTALRRQTSPPWRIRTNCSPERRPRLVLG